VKQFETEHYLFHYHPGSKAEADIGEIAATQEACFRHICAALDVKPDFKIRYFLCDSPEEVGHAYGDDDPCNGFASLPDKIYAVYNQEVQCIGFHEDAHILSYLINRPDSPAIREGLAMYFDKVWWGIPNEAWTAFFMKTGKYLPVDKLLDREFFFSQDCALSYPIMGAFTQWLISQWGMERYLQMYRQKEASSALAQVYGITPAQLDRDFAAYIGSRENDMTWEKQMSALCSR